MGNLKDFDNPEDWEAKKIDFFRNHFEEAKEWYSQDRSGATGQTYIIRKHLIEKAPDVEWEL